MATLSVFPSGAWTMGAWTDWSTCPIGWMSYDDKKKQCLLRTYEPGGSRLTGRSYSEEYCPATITSQSGNTLAASFEFQGYQHLKGKLRAIVSEDCTLDFWLLWKSDVEPKEQESHWAGGVQQGTIQPHADRAGHSFRVRLVSGSAIPVKAIASVAVGAIETWDLGACWVYSYGLGTVGAGFSAGITLPQATDWVWVKLKQKCVDWSGAAADTFTAGAQAAYGYSVTKLKLTLPTREIVMCDWAGWGAAASVQADGGTVSIGKLGERYDAGPRIYVPEEPKKKT